MTLLQVAVLGLVQGLAAFVPVSAAAHLRILPALFGWHFYGGSTPYPGPAFTASVRLGSTLALLVYFWRELLHVSVAWFRGLYDRGVRTSLEYRFGWYLIGVTIPLVVVGLLFHSRIQTGERNLWVLAGALIVVGLALLAAELVGRRRRVEEQLTVVDSAVVGAALLVALVPGASRVATAITAGLFRGLTRETAVRFAFLLSVPSVVVFSVYSAVQFGGRQHAGPGAGLVGVGVVVSFVAGLFAVHWLIGFVQRHSLLSFACYRLALGALVVALLATGVLEARA